MKRTAKLSSISLLPYMDKCIIHYGYIRMYAIDLPACPVLERNDSRIHGLVGSSSSMEFGTFSSLSDFVSLPRNPDFFIACVQTGSRKESPDVKGRTNDTIRVELRPLFLLDTKFHSIRTRYDSIYSGRCCMTNVENFLV